MNQRVTAFISIATTNHIPFSFVALKSISLTSKIKRVLFLIGHKDALPTPNCADIEVRHVEHYLEPAVIQRIVSRYTPAEVCFALKPYIIKLLLKEGLSSVHYIDSDIRFFSNADALEASLTEYDALLTPHYLQPFPNDHLKPSVLTLLRSGVFNAGYIGVNNTPTALYFLDWWAESVIRSGKNEPRNGTCGDQRWLDLVPVLFPKCAIFRHPGANVAYWNLHERPLLLNKENIYETGEYPLLFFHFSGFDINTPSQLTRYQNRMHNTDTTLAKLLAEYAQELRQARIQYPYATSYLYKRWWHHNFPCMNIIRRWLRKNW
ncbi:MAG: hypothetical protein IT497_09760 [Ottowia sp.]|nr:hypothetical protein [Ottowia sp.]